MFIYRIWDHSQENEPGKALVEALRSNTAVCDVHGAWNCPRCRRSTPYSAQMSAEDVPTLDLVLLTEELDLSLVLLRRALGWDPLDIAYLRLGLSTPYDRFNRFLT